MKDKEKHTALPEGFSPGEPSLHVESICTPHRPRFPTNLQHDIFTC